MIKQYEEKMKCFLSNPDDALWDHNIWSTETSEFAINEAKMILAETEEEKKGAGYHQIKSNTLDMFGAKSALAESLEAFCNEK